MSAPLPGGHGSVVPGGGTPANATPATPPTGPSAAMTAPMRWLMLGANIALLAICASIGGSLMLFPPARAALPGAIPTPTGASGAPAISTSFGDFPNGTPTRTHHPTPTHSSGGGLPPTATPRPTKPPQPTATPTITPIPATATPTNTPPDGT